jgi:hypothetical protein
MSECLWYALQVRTRQETAVSGLLSHKGYEVFLPVYSSRRRLSDRAKISGFLPDACVLASANPIHYLGAEPVFIDSKRASWNLDPQVLADALKQQARRKRLPKRSWWSICS